MLLLCRACCLSWWCTACHVHAHGVCVMWPWLGLFSSDWISASVTMFSCMSNQRKVCSHLSLLVEQCSLKKEEKKDRQHLLSLAFIFIEYVSEHSFFHLHWVFFSRTPTCSTELVDAINVETNISLVLDAQGALWRQLPPPPLLPPQSKTSLFEDALFSISRWLLMAQMFTQGQGSPVPQLLQDWLPKMDVWSWFWLPGQQEEL